jgi:hypothetical protein
MKKAIDNSKGQGLKALTDFYKELMGFTLRFNPSSSLDPHPPKYIVVLHTTLELVKDRNPKDLLLVLTNSEYYTMWECSEITDLLQCRLSRQWGSTDYWGDELDISSHMLAEAVFLNSEGVKEFDTLMTTTWEKVKPKKQTSPPPTPSAVEVRLNALQYQLRAQDEVLVAREIEFNKISLELHLAKGGTKETFVAPHPQSYVSFGVGALQHQLRWTLLRFSPAPPSEIFSLKWWRIRWRVRWQLAWRVCLLAVRRVRARLLPRQSMSRRS